MKLKNNIIVIFGFFIFFNAICSSGFFSKLKSTFSSSKEKVADNKKPVDSKDTKKNNNSGFLSKIKNTFSSNKVSEKEKTPLNKDNSKDSLKEKKVLLKNNDDSKKQKSADTKNLKNDASKNSKAKGNSEKNAKNAKEKDKKEESKGSKIGGFFSSLGSKIVNSSVGKAIGAIASNSAEKVASGLTEQIINKVNTSADDAVNKIIGKDDTQEKPVKDEGKEGEIANLDDDGVIGFVQPKTKEKEGEVANLDDDGIIGFVQPKTKEKEGEIANLDENGRIGFVNPKNTNLLDGKEKNNVVVPSTNHRSLKKKSKKSKIKRKK